MLSKKSPIPLYYQLAELIKEWIQSGRLPPGAQLPSERELSEQVAISRMTVRHAIEYLVRQGSLEVRQGIGTFVAEPKLTSDAVHLLGFTEEMMQQGRVVMSRVLEQAVVTPPPSVAAKLQLRPDETAVKIVRLRLSQDVPLLLETLLIPATLCPGLEHEDLATKSLYTLLEEKFGLRLERAQQTLEAVVANDYESQLFGVKHGTAMILVEGVTYLDDDRVVEYFKVIYRGDQFKFELQSTRNTYAYEEFGGSRVSVVLA